MKILVRSPNWIGDQILSYPFFYYLRQTYPLAQIVVACVPWVQSIQFRNLVDDVYLLPRPLNFSFFSKWDALEKGAQMLRSQGPWELGFCLPNSFSSAWFLFRAGVELRRGYATDGRSILLNQKLSWERKSVIHRAQAYLELLPPSEVPRPLATEFWGGVSENELDPPIQGVIPEFDAEKEWPGAEPFDPPSHPYWVLAPGSTAESRRWPIQKFVELTDLILSETGWLGVILGGEAEFSLASELVSRFGSRVLDWTGRGSVASLWKVFRSTQFTVCNDSGLAHMASCLSRSLVHLIWGGGDPRRTRPLGSGKIQLSVNPPVCWPCEQNRCSQIPLNHLECLKGITPHVVWNEIKLGVRFGRSPVSESSL